MYSRHAALAAASDFVRAVREGGIRITSAFVFGSYALGKARDDSDIDLAIVSPDFTGFRFDDLGKIARYKIRANADLEIHPFSGADFTEDNPFARTIIETGVRVV
jgi:uncharacterized protein